MSWNVYFLFSLFLKISERIYGTLTVKDIKTNITCQSQREIKWNVNCAKSLLSVLKHLNYLSELSHLLLQLLNMLMSPLRGNVLVKASVLSWPSAGCSFTFSIQTQSSINLLSDQEIKHGFFPKCQTIPWRIRLAFWRTSLSAVSRVGTVKSRATAEQKEKKSQKRSKDSERRRTDGGGSAFRKRELVSLEGQGSEEDGGGRLKTVTVEGDCLNRQ